MIELPTLYCRTRDGKINQWRVFTQDDVVVTEYGRLGGKMNKHMDRVRSMNVGKANERLGSVQAEAEAKSAWDKKTREGYFSTVQQAENTIVLLPMLAKPLEHEVKRKTGRAKVKLDLQYPLDVQPKLNGLRCLSIHTAPIDLMASVSDPFKPSRILLRSREGEDWTNLKHIEDALKYMIHPGEMADGEVYIHGTPLQILNSLIKRNQEQTLMLQYHIYDLPAFDGRYDHSWDRRYRNMRERYFRYVLAQLDFNSIVHLVQPSGYNLTDIEMAVDGQMPGSQLELYMRSLPLQLVPTTRVVDEGEARDVQKTYILQGFEGAILRQLQNPYEFNDRGDGIVKLKDFQDCNFEIVAVEGRELLKDGTSTHIVDKFRFKNNLNDRTFEAVPLGSMEQRAAWWKERDTLIGKFGTVRFLERSVDLIPQGNPVMVALRLDEDRGEEEANPWG
jgi:hypothetical protein